MKKINDLNIDDDKKLKQFIVNIFRRASFKWSPRGNAKKRYKIQVGVFKTGNPKFGYWCAYCGEICKSGEVKMDHIDAVINPITGFVGLDTYAYRMFCDEFSFCCLCENCHDIKSTKEREYRALFKIDRNQPALEAEYLNWLKIYRWNNK